MVKVSITYLALLATTAWAEGGFLCGGQLAPDVAAPWLQGPAKATQGHIPQTGTGIVLFAHFRDELPADAAIPEWADAIFDPDRPGSFSHFYDTMSFGRHRFRGDVAPRWYESLGNPADYVSEDPAEGGRYADFAQEILGAADANVDFSQFDNDGPDGRPSSGDDDGYVDAVFIVMRSMPAGFIFGGATGVAGLEFQELLTDDLGFNGQPLRIDPLKSTIQQGRSFAETVGTICHEYGHVLGLPDLFNTTFQQSAEPLGPEEDSAGIGNWGLMGWGATGWNGDDGPNSFSAWSRMKLGWTHTREISQTHEELRLPEIGKNGDVYRIPLGAFDFFLLEHRRRTSTHYDRHVPGEGLLIWHVDRGLDLESADGRWLDAGFPVGRQPDQDGDDNLDFWAHDGAYSDSHAGNKGDGTDPFDGERFKAFTIETNPAAYNNRRSRSIQVEDIHIDGDLAVAQVRTQSHLVELRSPTVTDASGDGILTADEEGTVLFRVVNRGGLVARNVRLALRTEEPLLEVIQADALLGDIQVGRASARPVGGDSFPRFRLGNEFSGTRSLALSLELSVDGVSVGTRAFQVDAVSTYLLTGRVTDSRGNGLPDIAIFLFLLGQRTFSLISGTDGSFEWELPPGSYYYDARGTVYANQSGNFQIRGDTNLEITLSDAFPVSGTVTDPEGTPLREVNVDARWRTGVAFAYTPADGSYTLMLPRGRHEILASRPAADPAAILPTQLFESIRVDGPRRFDMVLTKGVVATVQIVDPMGAGIGRVGLWATRPGVSTPVPADAEGVARLVLMPGVYQLHVGPVPGPPQTDVPLFQQTETPLLSVTSDTTLKIELEHTHVLTGSVRDDAVRPYFDAGLTFNPLNSGGSVSTAAIATDGTYQVHLPSGRFETAIIPGGLGSTPSQVLETITVGRDGIADFITDPGVPVTGELLDNTDRGEFGMHIIATSPSLAVSGSTELSGDGSFELFLKPGRYEFMASRDQTSFWSLGERDVLSDDHHEFHLPGGATLSGRVVDVTGQPVADLAIALTKHPLVLTNMSSALFDAAPRFFHDGSGFATAVQGDSRGAFELSARPGTYTAVMLPENGRDIGMVREIALSGHRQATFTLPSYDTYHEVYGQVLSEPDVPRGNATLLFYCKETGSVLQSRTFNSGTYHFRLPPGTYQVKAGLFSSAHGFYRVYDLGSVSLDRDRRWDIRLEATTTAIAETPIVQPSEVTLRQNYPNPFNPTTSIRYEISEAAQVELTVYDILGREVITLVRSRQPAGAYSIRWHGRDTAGREVASGVYIYRLVTSSGRDLFVDSRKLVLIR